MGIKAGITGGIGSGKTTVCKMFEVLGVPVYYADDRAKDIMTEDPELVNAISKRFGTADIPERSTAAQGAGRNCLQ